jgi:lipoprotein-anchoring transpeptidase ErfK/SrfK
VVNRNGDSVYQTDAVFVLSCSRAKAPLRRVHDENSMSTSMKKMYFALLASACSLGFGFPQAAANEADYQSQNQLDRQRPLYPQQPSYQPQPSMMPQQTMQQPGMSEPARPAFDPKFEKQIVDYSGRESPGTVVVDTPNKFLYLVEGNGKAMRYGIGVGRPGFTWSGVKTISAKKEWPEWTPPSEMLARRPDLPRHMEGGPQNPLGARAMYLGSTLYRIHGSNEPWTIGTNVSSGCIRMRNEDVIDLYGRVNVGTKVVVI